MTEKENQNKLSLASSRGFSNTLIENKVGYNFVVIITILIISILIAILSINQTSAAYLKSNPAVIRGGFDSSIFTSGITGIPKEQCNAGQDFIMQIDPLGCTPSVIRSDLLEEQDYPVFCPITITKVNPLVSVEAIDRIKFSGGRPAEVSEIGYYPSKAALAQGFDKVNSPILDNIGYAVIVLKQNKNESSMPNFVEGEITAEITYDLKNAFGVGRTTFYLPELSDSEWFERKEQYSFWDGKGYARAENINPNSAIITLSNDVREFGSFNLMKGEQSYPVYMPGFECLAGLQVRLDSLEAPGTTARIIVDGDVFELRDEERFLDNKCIVKDIKRYGSVEKVEISCGRERFSLLLSPRVNLSFEGANQEGYGVGDFLFSFKDENNSLKEHYVYLGYAGTGKTEKEKDLEILLFSKTSKGENNKLTEQEILEAEKAFDTCKLNNKGESGDAGFYSSCIKKGFVGFVDAGVRAIFTAKTTDTLSLGQEKKFGGRDVRLLGFAGPRDIDLSAEKYAEVLKNYGYANQDFNTILENFAQGIYPKLNNVTKGEEAFYEKIKLAYELNQKRTAVELCEEFFRGYPYSNFIKTLNSRGFCDDKISLSSSSIRSKPISVGRELKNFFLADVFEPSYNELGAMITVRFADGRESIDIKLQHNERYVLNASKNDFVELSSVKKDASSDFAILKIWASKGFSADTRDFFGSSQTIKEGETKTFNEYVITVTEVKLQNFAKVTIKPSIDYTKSNATFPFKIGIEKRGIQLTPEQIQNRITNLNSSIEKWNNVNDKLGKVVKGLKTACFATGAVFTINNFLNNLNGKAIARQEAMRGEGGWNDICKNDEECLLKNDPAVDRTVDALAEYIDSHNDLMDKIPGENTQKKKENYLSYLKDSQQGDLKGDFERVFGGDVFVTEDGEEINLGSFVDNLKGDSASFSQFRDLGLYANAGQSRDEVLNGIARKKLESRILRIHNDNKDETERKGIFSELSNAGLNLEVTSYGSNNAITGVYYGGSVLASQISLNLPQEDDSGNEIKYPVEIITYNSKKYVVLLEGKGNNYIVDKVYDYNGISNGVIQVGSEAPSISSAFRQFEKFDSQTYNNPYLTSTEAPYPVLKYFETEPYKGFPALVPFDLRKGWYVSVSQTLPAIGNVRAYDESGRINSFYLCNVGKNGKEENRQGNDKCRSFMNRQTYNQFYGLSDDETRVLVDRAINAVAEAQEARQRQGSGIKEVEIEGQIIKVGEPAVNIPDIRCTDVYSPTECKFLFNVCDPVVCPSSRCNLGGAYNVEDVVQTGVFGSLLLCLPNFPEVVVPVCLTGIHAGIDGWTKIQESYRDCLKHNLETGETVGICDEIHSIYACEFFWRQGIPLAKLAGPKLLEFVSGQSGSKGGGEYLGVQSALDSADKSVDFFTQYYAKNSFDAFKARSTANVGTEVCKNFVSLVVPTSGESLDKLTDPDSPPQFHGWFDEIPYTTATNPPASQYKVFYHIYAGKDRGAFWRVYLKGTPETSFYQDTGGIRVIDSGFVEAGKVATATRDFTGVSGFKELCIVVNDDEKCGFKQVSTDFLVNSIKDSYLAGEASRENIQGDRDCVAGQRFNPAAVLQNLNPQTGVEEFASPELYNTQIVRVCATQMETPRWKPVGECDDPGMRCWLDTESVKQAIKNLDLEKEVLENQSEKAFEILSKEFDYMDEKEFSENLKKLDKITNSEEKINAISDLLERTFFPSHKGHLLLKRGIEFGKIALNLLKEIRPEIPSPFLGDEEEFEEEEGVGEEVPEGFVSIGYDPQEISQLVEDSRGFVVFQFQDGTGDKDPYFSYYEDEWRVSDDEENWIGLNNFVSYDVPMQVDYFVMPQEKGMLNLIFNYYAEREVWRWGVLEEGKELFPEQYFPTVNWRIVGEFDFDAALKDSEEALRLSKTFDYVSSKIALINSLEGKNNLVGEGILIANGARVVSASVDSGTPFEVSKIQDETGFNERNSEFISSLILKNYEEGLELLIDRTLSNDDGGLFPNWLGGGTKLETDVVELNYDGVFKFKNRIDDKVLSVKFINDKWYWRTDSGDFFEIIDLKQGESVITTPYPDFNVNFYNKNILKSNLQLLVGENLYSGGKMVFDFKKKDEYPFEEISGPEISAIVQEAAPKGVLSYQCSQYTESVVRASEKYNIPDPLLLMSIMQQESSCDAEPENSGKGCVGLMQICSWNLCKDIGVRSINDVKGVNNVNKNIECGAKILGIKYKEASKGRLFNGCSGRNVYYYDWSAAVRGYNGWGCDRNFLGQDYYVEEVMERYKDLQALSLNV